MEETTNDNSLLKGSFVTSNNTTREKNAENKLVASLERFSLELLESVEAVLTFDHPEVYLAERKVQLPRTIFSETEEILIAENMKNINTAVEKDKRWILGAHLSPGYSSQSTSHTEQYAQNISYTGESGSNNVGAGLSVQYKTGKKLRIESGVYYAQNSQGAKNSFDLFALSGNSDAAFSGADRIEANSPAFSNAVQLSNSGISMNSTAGVINMKSTPRGTEVATDLESSKSGYGNTLLTN